MQSRMNKRICRLRKGNQKVERNAKEVQRSGGNNRLFHKPRRRLDVRHRLQKEGEHERKERKIERRRTFA